MKNFHSILSLTLSILLVTSVSLVAQDYSNYHDYFGFPDDLEENVQKRDRYSKHFEMPNGNTKAFISTGSLHYKDDNGNWQNISTLLRPSSEPAFVYENSKNNIKTFFPEESSLAQTGVKVGIGNSSLRAGISPSFDALDSYFDVVYEESSAGAINLTVDQNVINYEGFLPNATNSFEIQPDLLKNNVILESLDPQLAQGEFLGYSENINLPAGWKIIANQMEVSTTSITGGGLFIVNEVNQVKYAIPVPEVYEANDRNVNLHPNGNWEFAYKISNLGNGQYRLTTLVPTDWLTDSQRNYPVVIDPTITENGNWGGWQKPGSNGVEGNPSIYVYCGWSTDPYHAWTKWDISAIPTGSIVIDTDLQAYMNATGGTTAETIDLNDVTGTYGPYSGYNASAYTDLGNGNYTFFTATTVGVYGYFDLGASADADVQASIGGGEFQVAFVNDATGTVPYKRFTSNLNMLQVEYVNCSGQISATINPATLSNGYNLGCNGDSNATVSTSATNGSGTYYYIFDGPNYYDTIANPSNLHAGTYFVSVFDDNQTCPDTMTITITEPPLSLDFNLSQAGNYNISCFGDNNGTIGINVLGGTFNYSWSGPGGFTSTSQNLSSLGAGWYNVTLTETTFGCIVEDSVELTQPPIVTANTTLDSNAFCEDDMNGGASVTVGGGIAPYTVAWDDPGSSTTLSVGGLGVGTYIVTVTDDNGCTATDDVVIGFESPLPNINLGPDTGICEGGSVLLNAGGGFLAYEWNTGVTGQILQVNQLGVYEVTVTNFEGCQNSDAIEVTDVYPLPSPNLGPNISTGATPVTLDPGNYVKYVWSTGSFNPTISVSLSGTYAVTVTDNNGCKGEDEIKVTIWPAGIADADDSQMKLYPNPANDRLIFEVENAQSGDLNVSISNMAGQIVMQQQAVTVSRLELDVTQLAPGSYIFKAQNDQVNWSQMLLIE